MVGHCALLGQSEGARVCPVPWGLGAGTVYQGLSGGGLALSLETLS